MLEQQRDAFVLEYRRLAETIPALIWVADETGRTIYANRRWYDYTGLDLAEKDEAFVREELVHPLDRPRLLEAWQSASDGSSGIDVEYRLRAHDGSYRWVVARAIPLRDENGVVRQWLGAAVDVHAQKTAAEYLREMMEAVPQIVYTSDPQSGVDYYNRRWYDLTGQTEEEARGAGWQHVIHPDDIAALIDIYSSSKAAGRPYRAEYRIRRKADGAYRWHTVSARPVTDVNGAIVKWVGVATDIEDQKRREAAMRLVADASELLASSFDVERRLEAVAKRVVPEFADWCAIYLKRDGVLEPVAIAHRDPQMIEFIFRVMNRYPPRENEASRQVLAGKPFVVPVVSEEMLAAAAQDDMHLELIHKLDVRSSLQMPIVDRGNVLGSIHVVNGASGRIFDDEDVRLIEILTKRAAVALDNARVYERERRVANTFQQAALPRVLPEIAGVSLSAMYHPAESEAEVGGDWYDAFLIDDRTLVLTMGDVSGKGLDAAVLMSVLRQALRVAALESQEPARTVASADRALRMEHPGHVASAIVLFVDLDTLGCRYVNAGHPPALVRHADGTIVELDEVNAPLGVFETRADSAGSVALQKDSLLALYTDGLIESTRDVIEGVQRLRDTLAVDAIVHTPNPARLLYDTVLDREPRDDVAILTVSFGRSRHWSFDARDASRAQGARASFVRHLHEQGDPTSDFSAAEVIFGELTGNVVRYAPGPIDIDLEWTEEEPVLHVLDRGAPFSLLPVLPADPLSENGRGLYIVQTLGKQLRAQPLPHRGNHVSITLPVRRRAAR